MARQRFGQNFSAFFEELHSLKAFLSDSFWGNDFLLKNMFESFIIFINSSFAVTSVLFGPVSSWATSSAWELIIMVKAIYTYYALK